MPALAEIDLGTLTPDQAAAVGALRAEIGVLEDRNAAQADRKRHERPTRYVSLTDRRSVTIWEVNSYV